MALTNSTQWRVRTGGNNANGAGYDPTTSGALATTLTGAYSSGGTTITVASATGWPSSGNYYVQIGAAGAEPSGGGSMIALVTGGQGTTTWTITPAQLGTSNLSFASGVAVTNELSRCNTAPWSGSTGTSSASTTFTAAAAGFNETVVGNILWIASGTGATTGPYRVTGYTNSTTITLDRISGTYSNAAWKIGGAWADPRTNVAGSANILPGNRVFIRGSGSATVASPDYTLSDYITTPRGDLTNGRVDFIGENGRPVIASTYGLIWYQCYYNSVINQYLVATGSTNLGEGVVGGAGRASVMRNCIIDQGGRDVDGIKGFTGLIMDTEVWSSTANSGAAGSNYGIRTTTGYGTNVIRCNIHDCWGRGVYLTDASTLFNSIVSKNRGLGAYIVNGDPLQAQYIQFTTFDANNGGGVAFADAQSLTQGGITNCFITNHTTASTYGIDCNFGTTAANDRMREAVYSNWFYNNTSDARNLTVTSGSLNGMIVGDSVGVDPQYAGQSVQNFAVGANPFQWSVYQFMNSKSGTTAPKTYLSPGGVQSAPSTIVIAPIQYRIIEESY